MSAIKEALAKLDAVVGSLEGSLMTLESAIENSAKSVGGQPDMFSSVSNENGEPVDGAVVAKKLDVAINKVESVLKEAQG